MEKISVVIPAYQRAEKLIGRIEEIKGWPRLGTLLISVDGPRPKSDQLELERRFKVIEVAEYFANVNSQIEVKVWSNNLGVNTHTQRFLKLLLPQGRGVIVIEDDVSVSYRALDFLAENHDLLGSAAAAAHTSHSHLDLAPDLVRRTLFPVQWGQAISVRAMEIYVAVMNGFPISRRSVRRAIFRNYEDKLSRKNLEFLTQWWFNHFFFCRRHGNWADAIVQYSVMASGGYYRVPNRSLIIDDSDFFDSRALTPRAPTRNELTCVEKVTTPYTAEFDCLSCDLRESHIQEAKLRNILGATRFRRKLMFQDRIRSKTT